MSVCVGGGGGCSKDSYAFAGLIDYELLLVCVCVCVCVCV